MTHQKRFLLSIVISCLIHVFAYAACYMAFESSNTTSMSEKKVQGHSFSIALTQISNANKQEDSNLASIQSQSSQNNMQEKQIEPKKTEKIIKNNNIKKKIDENSKKHCEKCSHSKKVVEQNIPKMQTTDIKSDNEINQINGNKQSGDAHKSDEGVNINGLIYKAILKHKDYPKKAKIMRAQGSVVVTFMLQDKNTFSILEITKSSGFLVLDTHALKIIKKAKHEFPAQAIGQKIVVPINFNLKE